MESLQLSVDSGGQQAPVLGLEPGEGVHSTELMSFIWQALLEHTKDPRMLQKACISLRGASKCLLGFASRGVRRARITPHTRLATDACAVQASQGSCPALTRLPSAFPCLSQLHLALPKEVLQNAKALTAAFTSLAPLAPTLCVLELDSCCYMPSLGLAMHQACQVLPKLQALRLNAVAVTDSADEDLILFERALLSLKGEGLQELHVSFCSCSWEAPRFARSPEVVAGFLPALVSTLGRVTQYMQQRHDSSSAYEQLSSSQIGNRDSFNGGSGAFAGDGAGRRRFGGVRVLRLSGVEHPLLSPAGLAMLLAQLAEQLPGASDVGIELCEAGEGAWDFGEELLPFALPQLHQQQPLPHAPHAPLPHAPPLQEEPQLQAPAGVNDVQHGQGQQQQPQPQAPQQGAAVAAPAAAAAGAAFTGRSMVALIPTLKALMQPTAADAATTNASAAAGPAAAAAAHMSVWGSSSTAATGHQQHQLARESSTDAANGGDGSEGQGGHLIPWDSLRISFAHCAMVHVRHNCDVELKELRYERFRQDERQFQSQQGDGDSGGGSGGGDGVRNGVSSARVGIGANDPGTSVLQQQKRRSRGAWYAHLALGTPAVAGSGLLGIAAADHVAANQSTLRPMRLTSSNGYGASTTTAGTNNGHLRDANAATSTGNEGNDDDDDDGGVVSVGQQAAAQLALAMEALGPAVRVSELTLYAGKADVPVTPADGSSDGIEESCNRLSGMAHARCERWRRTVDVSALAGVLPHLQRLTVRLYQPGTTPATSTAATVAATATAIAADLAPPPAAAAADAAAADHGANMQGDQGPRATLAGTSTDPSDFHEQGWLQSKNGSDDGLLSAQRQPGYLLRGISSLQGLRHLTVKPAGPFCKHQPWEASLELDQDLAQELLELPDLATVDLTVLPLHPHDAPFHHHRHIASASTADLGTPTTMGWSVATKCGLRSGSSSGKCSGGSASGNGSGCSSENAFGGGSSSSTAPGALQDLIAELSARLGNGLFLHMACAADDEPVSAAAAAAAAAAAPTMGGSESRGRQQQGR